MLMMTLVPFCVVVVTLQLNQTNYCWRWSMEDENNDVHARFQDANDSYNSSKDDNDADSTGVVFFE